MPDVLTRARILLRIASTPEGCWRRNTRCVNPAHLEPVTMRENLLRGDTIPGRNARKSRCVRGHPLAGANLYMTPDGRRQCRTCRRLTDARRR